MTNILEARVGLLSYELSACGAPPFTAQSSLTIAADLSELHVTVQPKLHLAIVYIVLTNISLFMTLYVLVHDRDKVLEDTLYFYMCAVLRS